MNRNFILLLVLSTAVYSANIWNTSVYVLDEAKNAGCAMEMYQRNDWIVPTFNQQLRTDKPPLHYYHMMGAFRVFGVNPFAARIFSSVMGILTVLCVYLFGRKLAGESTALFASLILIASLQLAIQFHLAVPDPYLIFFLTFGWLSFIYGFSFRKHLFYYLFYIAVGLGTLAKGPVAIIFSGLLVLIFLIAQRKLSIKTLFETKVVQGFFILLAIVLPWYFAVSQATDGEWIAQFFLKHNVNRFTSSMEGHGGFPLASLVIAIGALIPFSFFFPQAFRLTWKEQKSNPFLQFSGIAMSIVIVFFALSRTILPNYPEPSLPFFAILLGYFFSRIAERRDEIRKQKLYVNAIAYLIVAIALPIVVWIGLGKEDSLQALQGVAVYFLLLSLGALIALYFILKQEIVKAFYSYVTSMVIFLMCFFYIIFPKVDKQNPVLQSTALVEGKNKPLLYYKNFNPSYVFALQQPIKAYGAIDEIVNDPELKDGFYLITQKRYLPELELLGGQVLFQGKDLFEKQVTVVIER